MATPIPPRIARKTKSSSRSESIAALPVPGPAAVVVVMAAIAFVRRLDGGVERHHPSLQGVAMAVGVAVHRDAFGRARPEQRRLFGMLAPRPGRAGTADMEIEAQHLLGSRHPPVQFLWYHDTAA